MAVYARHLNSSTVTFTISAAVPVLAVSSVSPGVIANSGSSTLQISGQSLSASDTYELVGTGGTFAASSAQVSDPTSAYATFVLAGATPGTYSLRVTQPDSQSVTLASAVSVSTTNTDPTLWLELELPSVSRVGRVINGSLEYANTGNADMPAPIIILTTGQAAGLRLDSTDSFSTDDLLLLGASLNGPAGILRPGQVWSIAFSCMSSSSATIPFEADYELATSTNLADYSSLASQLRPAGYSDTDWNTIWGRFQVAAGPTWGGLIQVLGNYATKMAMQDPTTRFYSVGDVLGFAFSDILQAANSNVAGTLYLNDTNSPLAGTYLLLGSATSTNSAADVSSSDGSFRIPTLPAGTYQFSVPGYLLSGPAQVIIPASGTITGLAVTVTQGGSISGVVKSEANRLLLTNMTVEAVDENGTNYFSTTTASDGSYVLSGLTEGAYDLDVSGGGYAIQYLAALTVTNGQNLTGIDFLLGAGAAVHGWLLAGSTPLPNATATIVDSAGTSLSAATDTNGEFVLGGLAAGGATLYLEAANYATLTTGVSLVAGLDLNLGNIQATPAASVYVSLLDQASNAVTVAEVTLLQNGSFIAQTYPDTNGQATLTGLAAGSYELRIRPGALMETETNIILAAGDSFTGTFVLSPGGGVSGHVVDGSGSPIAGMAVNLFGLSSSNADIALSIQTDSNGSYKLTGLPNGPYAVTAGNSGGILRQETTIDATHEQATLNFIMSGKAVSGLVVAANGRTPVNGAMVNLSQGGNLLALSLTDANGMYRFRNLSSGDYNLSAISVTAGMTAPQTFSATAAIIAGPTLVLGSLTLSGTVTDTNGVLLSDAGYALLPTNTAAVGEFSAGSTDTNGQFSIAGLAPGGYTLKVRRSDYVLLVQTLTISATTNLAIQLQAGAIVAGSVTDARTAAPVSGALIAFLDPATHEELGSFSTSSNGTYAATGLPVGRCNVLISQTNYQIVEITNVAVVAGSSALNAVLQGETTILSGTVEDTSGYGVANVNLDILNAQGEVITTLTTDADGAWSIAQVPPGNYTVAVSVLGYWPVASTPVALAAGAPQTLQAVLTPGPTDDSSSDETWQYTAIAIENAFEIVQISPPDDPHYYPTTAPSCECSRAAFKKLLQAKHNMEAKWQSMYDAYNNRKISGGASTVAASAQVAKLLGAMVAAFGTFGESAAACEALDKASTAGKVTVGALQAIRAGLAIDGAVNDFVGAYRNGGRVGVLTAKLVGDLKNIQASVGNFDSLVKALEGEPGWSAGGSLGVTANALQTVAAFADAYNKYEAALSAYELAELNFGVADMNYLQAWLAYIRSDADDCVNCPPHKPKPPKVPDPIKGPKDPVPVGQSVDPNAKLSTGFGPAGFVRPGLPIIYTIEFENQATATLPAQQVVITDQFDTNLDWSTLELKSVGFNTTNLTIPAGVLPYAELAGVPTDTNAVEVTVAFDSSSGRLTCQIESVDPVTGQLVTDPLAGFLPPNDSQGHGAGYLCFSVSPKTNLLSGLVITNQASIVFDVNNPILTDIATNTIDISAPVSAVSAPATPTNSSLVTLSLSRLNPGPDIVTCNVFAAINGGPWFMWLTNTADTSVVFQGVPGNSYSFYSIAYDGLGYQEAAKTNADLTLGTLTVAVVGDGALEPDYAGAGFKQVGSNYTIKAIPGFGSTFTGWSGGIVSSAASISFTMSTGLVLQASFAPIPYAPTNGTYYGLFYPATGVTHERSGAITVTTTAKRKYTGKLQVGGGTYSISGQLDASGTASTGITLANQGSSTVRLTMLGSDWMTGTVSNANWVAGITADRAVYSSKSPWAALPALYTLTVAGTDGDSTLPGGDGYGTATISKFGTISFAGSLADGTKVTQSVPISQEGQWPLYVALYKGQGSILGRLTLTNAAELGGGLAWTRPETTTLLYPAGFAWMTEVSGGRYYAPGKGTNILAATNSSVVLILEGDGLADNITNTFTLNAENQVKNPSLTNKLTLSFTPSSGLFSGSQVIPGNPKGITFQGVIVRGQTNGAGYFLGTEQSGRVVLEPQP